MKHIVLIAVLILVGCGKKDEAPPATGDVVAAGSAGSSTGTTSAGNAAFEARSVFQTLCATCHGPKGLGDGQAAAALDPKPRNYTDKAWQASVTDDDLRNIIKFGGAAVGKSAVMPGAPQLKDKPEVIDELVKIIRNFGK
jgi:mono/diheme cytochrome c family protein